MKHIFVLLCTMVAISGVVSVETASAFNFLKNKENSEISKVDTLTPHKALYDIILVSRSSGSQIANIKGEMYYETNKTCDAWVTDHRFSLTYEYADSPAMRIKSDFSTYEYFDGNEFHFSTRRHRDGQLYEEFRGSAETDNNLKKARFSIPHGTRYNLKKETLYPMAHTARLVEQALDGKKFYKAVIFDGSDSDGAVEINSFIGSTVEKEDFIKGEKIDKDLLGSSAWNVRMAAFPLKEKGSFADYEMSMVFHQNGIVSDMVIDYDNFSVRQKLVALEKLDGQCQSNDNVEN